MASMLWEADLEWYLSQCICINESRYGWYLSSQHPRLDSTDHNQSPSGSTCCYFSLHCNLTHVLHQVHLLFSVAPLSSSLTTPLLFTLFGTVMVHLGNIHYVQREILLGVSLLLFLYGITVVRDNVFVYMGRWVWVCQRAFTKGSALGVSKHCCSGRKKKRVEVILLTTDVANNQLCLETSPQ